jgi:sulfate transport system ATP-binding protein
MGIETSGLSKSFNGHVALDDVSVVVPEGSLTAILGPSGGGKSTLLRVIAGLERPDSGTVAINGRDVTHDPAQDRGIGFVFQHYAAFKHMTVRDNVGFGLRIRKRPKAEIRKRVDELLELVQLETYEGRYPAQLSGGQRQRMALARALAIEPRLLLLDEPFGALDARVRKDLRGWLKRLQADVGVTTVFVTHDQEEAMDLADQIVLVNDGRVEQAGTPHELYETPANDFVMSFVGLVTTLDGRLVRPHDVQLLPVPGSESDEAVVDRVSRLGFEVRVELTRASGERLVAQLSRAEERELELREGDIVHVRGVDGAALVA